MAELFKSFTIPSLLLEVQGTQASEQACAIETKIDSTKRFMEKLHVDIVVFPQDSPDPRPMSLATLQHHLRFRSYKLLSD